MSEPYSSPSPSPSPSASPSPSPCPCNVEIVAPDGIYVGCGRDEAPITLEAVVTPVTGDETYAWDQTGDGSGDFGTPAEQQTTLTGITRGTDTVTVDVVKSGCGCSASLDVYVIEVNDLPAMDSPELMDIEDVSDSGEFTVPLNGAAGLLRAVLIAAPDSESNPFIWGTDFDAKVTHSSGDVVIRLYRSGPYTVKVVRTGSDGNERDEYYKLLNNAGIGLYSASTAGTKIAATTDREEPNLPRDYDLVLICSNNDGFLNCARGMFPLHVGFSSVAQVNAAIIATYTAVNVGAKTPRKIKVALIDHGDVGVICMGMPHNAPDLQPGKYIAWADRQSQIDQLKFQVACQMRVSEFHFYNCCIAGKPQGVLLCQQIATGSVMTIKAYSDYTYFDIDSHTGFHFYYDKGDGVQPKTFRP